MQSKKNNSERMERVLEKTFLVVGYILQISALLIVVSMALKSYLNAIHIDEGQSLYVHFHSSFDAWLASYITFPLKYPEPVFFTLRIHSTLSVNLEFWHLIAAIGLFKLAGSIGLPKVILKFMRRILHVT